MKKFHVTIWVGIALIVAGAYRLVAPFSTSIGSIHTSCGNAVAYLDGQDNATNFVTTLAVCAKSLRLASFEGAGACVVGLVSFVVGLVFIVRARRTKRVIRRAERAAVRETVRANAAAANAAGANTGTANVSNANTGVPNADANMGRRDMSSPEVYEQFMRIGRLTRPKTVLSFFGVLFAAALVAGSVVAISLFQKNSELSRYIPWILVFDAVVAIVLIVGVFVTITKDPARLMLSEITNQNAVALQRGRRREDPPSEAITVRRVVNEEERRDVAQFRRRWDDPPDRRSD